MLDERKWHDAPIASMIDISLRLETDTLYSLYSILWYAQKRWNSGLRTNTLSVQNLYFVVSVCFCSEGLVRRHTSLFPKTFYKSNTKNNNLLSVTSHLCLFPQPTTLRECIHSTFLDELSKDLSQQVLSSPKHKNIREHHLQIQMTMTQY